MNRAAQSAWSLSAIDNPGQSPLGSGGLALVRTFSDATLVQAGITLNLRRGDLAVITGPTTIAYKGPVAASAEVLDFGNTRLALQIARGRRISPTLLDANDPLASLLGSLWAPLDQVQSSELLQDAAGRQLMELVAGLTMRLLDLALVSRLSHYSSATLARAKIEIDSNFQDPQFTVTTLAAKMRLSSRRLLSLFADEGTTTSGSIQDRRLQHARELLGDPDCAHRRIASIAAASGFRDQAYFSRCFRKMFGVTPKDYRDGCLVMTRTDGRP